MAPDHPQYIEAWPEESREAAQLVIDQYGKPDEITETQLMWHKPADRGAADPDTRMLSDEDLKQATKEGKERG